MDRQAIINKTMTKLAMDVKNVDNKKVIQQILDKKVPEASVPRYIFNYAEQRHFNDDQRLKLMQDMIAMKVHEISPKYKQGVEYLRDKMFKIPRESLRI